MKNDIGRHILLLREIKTNRFQEIKKCFLMGIGEMARGLRCGLCAFRWSWALLQLERLIAFQDRAAAFIEGQATIPFHIHIEQTMGEKLAEDRLPVRAGDSLAHAIGAELVMAELPDLLGFRTDQDIDDMARAKHLAAPVDAGKSHLRRFRRIEKIRRFQAVITVVAGFGRLLPEIFQDQVAAAKRALAELKEGFEFRAVELLLGEGLVRILHQEFEFRHILKAVGKPGIGGQAIAPGAARLLIIALHIFRQVQMGDEPHIRLVDAHAEGDSRDNDHRIVFKESCLRRLSRRRLQSGVIGERNAPGRGNLGGNLLYLFPGHAIDDARILVMLRFDEVEQLRRAIVLCRQAVADIRPVKSGAVDFPEGKPEPLDNILLRRLVSRRGEGEARNVWKFLMEDGKSQIFRAEIMAPLRDAMRLVNREERNLRARDKIEKTAGEQPFRRDVKEF